MKVLSTINQTEFRVRHLSIKRLPERQPTLDALQVPSILNLIYSTHTLHPSMALISISIYQVPHSTKQNI